MLDEQDCDTPVGRERTDQVSEFLRLDIVEARCRLVEEQDRRFAGDRPGDRGPPALTERELLGLQVEQRAELKLLDRRRRRRVSTVRRGMTRSPM